MKFEPKDRRKLADAALGRIPCDLAIRKVNLVNVLTGEIYPAEVGILDGFIACVSADPDGNGTLFPIEAAGEYDGRGEFLLPGFIDAHVHIESSMVTPANMAAAVVPQGTTTIITDPHEAANVGGIEAVRYMIDAARDLPLRVYVLAPSCVPAVPGLEHAGAYFGPAEMDAMLDMDSVPGIAEIMDYAGVLDHSERMEGILEAGRKRGVFLQGHAPFLSGRRLNGYIASGIESDHESRTAAEAREKMRLGMFLDAREGSVSTNIETLVGAVKDFPSLTNLTLCTDDREPEDLLTQGHMNYVVSRAVKAGLPPVQAITCGTLNVARELGLRNLGAVAPGWAADLQIVPDISEPKARAVFFGGELVAENGELIVPLPVRNFAQEHRNTVNVKVPDMDELRIKATGERARIRIVVYDSPQSSFTRIVEEEVPVKDGFLDLSSDPDLMFAAVINRHGRGNLAVAVVRGFGAREGAVASTVAHDSHNLAIVYDRPENALVAIKTLSDSGGGHCAVRNGTVTGHLPLPIFGLLSPLPCGPLVRQVNAMKEALRSLGVDTKNPVMRIVSITLPVIPEGKITDLGIVDVNAQKIVPLFVE